MLYIRWLCRLEFQTSFWWQWRTEWRCGRRCCYCCCGWGCCCYCWCCWWCYWRSRSRRAVCVSHRYKVCKRPYHMFRRIGVPERRLINLYNCSINTRTYFKTLKGFISCICMFLEAFLITNTNRKNRKLSSWKKINYKNVSTSSLEKMLQVSTKIYLIELKL